jgi:hypothetical protein
MPTRGHPHLKWEKVMLAIERLPEHQHRTDPTLADLALFGFELGKQCAQRLHRGYGTSPLQPDPSPLSVIVHFLSLADRFIADGRASNGLMVEGENAYRAGYQRGLEVQLQNPKADVVLKITRPEDVR